MDIVFFENSWFMGKEGAGLFSFRHKHVQWIGDVGKPSPALPVLWVLQP